MVTTLIAGFVRSVYFQSKRWPSHASLVLCSRTSMAPVPSDNEAGNSTNRPAHRDYRTGTAVRLLADVLARMATGQAVTLISLHAELKHPTGRR